MIKRRCKPNHIVPATGESLTQQPRSEQSSLPIDFRQRLPNSQNPDTQNYLPDNANFTAAPTPNRSLCQLGMLSVLIRNRATSTDVFCSCEIKGAKSLASPIFQPALNKSQCSPRTGRSLTIWGIPQAKYSKNLLGRLMR